HSVAAPLSLVEFNGGRSASFQGPLSARHRAGKARRQAGRSAGISHRSLYGEGIFSRAGSAGSRQPLASWVPGTACAVWLVLFPRSAVLFPLIITYCAIAHLQSRFPLSKSVAKVKR